MNDSIGLFAKNKTVNDINGEIWKPIRDSEVYFISNYGRVRSRNHHSMKVLEQQKNNCGYWRVSLSLQKGQAKYYLVSRLVAEAFSPDDEARMKEVHHKKGKEWNTADTLIFLTKEEHNQEHKKLKEQKNDGKE